MLCLLVLRTSMGSLQTGFPEAGIRLHSIRKEAIGRKLRNKKFILLFLSDECKGVQRVKSFQYFLQSALEESSYFFSCLDLFQQTEMLVGLTWEECKELGEKQQLYLRAELQVRGENSQIVEFLVSTKFLIFHIIVLISAVKRNAGVQTDGDLHTLAIKLFVSIKML